MTTKKKQKENLAEIHWEGDSKKVLSKFPKGIKADFGVALFALQKGAKPINWRPMTSVGPGVFELKDQDKSHWYRVITLSKIGNKIFVLHSFKKSSRKTSKEDLTTAKERFKKVLSRLKEERKNEKRKKK